MEKKRVLMTYMESGMGHITSIKSISDNLKKYYGDKYEILDEYIMRSDKHTQRLEKFIISQTKNTNRIKGFGNFVFFLMNVLGEQKLMRFFHHVFTPKALKSTLEAFDRYKPDCIVSTHYYMTFAGLEYKKKYNKNCQIITYNPDNNVHPWWDNRDSLFIVNNENAYFEAVGKRRFSPERVKQVFFTAREDLLKCTQSKEELREKLGIPLDKFCCMVADGAYACANAKAVTKQLLKIDKPITIILLAGKNEKVKAYFEKIKDIKPNITFIILPFCPTVYEYYKASDVFITKAGPNAILDSVFMGTPVLVDYYAHPIEKETTKLFIDTYGCGVAIYKPKLIKEQVEQWIDNRELLEQYRENLLKFDMTQNGGEQASKMIDEELSSEHITITEDEYLNRLYTLASEGKFDSFTTPINYENMSKLPEDYDYKPKNPLFKIYRAIIKSVMYLIGPLVNYVGFGIKIKGRKNLRKVKNGITISNHVHYLDSLWNFQAMSFKNFYITGAEHNNKKGLFGATMKAGGFLPLSSSLSNNKKFNECLGQIFENGGFVHFYPEQSLWLKYEQSRPLKKGAFHYASKFNVPIIPMIICFKKSYSIKKYRVVVNICKPIYPDPNLSVAENTTNLLKQAQEIYDQTIVEFYDYKKETYDKTKVAEKVEKKKRKKSK